MLPRGMNEGDDVLVVRGQKAGTRGRLVAGNPGQITLVSMLGRAVLVDPKDAIVAERRYAHYVRPADRDALAALLQQLRAANVSGARSKWGDCELVADEFLSEARRRGLASEKDSAIVWGHRAYDPKFATRRRIEDKEGQHQWVVIGETIYDGTSDQFGDAAITIAPVGDRRYREKTRLGHTFRR